MRNCTTYIKPTRFKCLTVSSFGEHTVQPHFCGASTMLTTCKTNVSSCDKAEDAQTINLEMLSNWKPYSRMFLAVSSDPLASKFLTDPSHNFTTFVWDLKGERTLFPFWDPYRIIMASICLGSTWKFLNVKVFPVTTVNLGSTVNTNLTGLVPFYIPLKSCRTPE